MDSKVATPAEPKQSFAVFQNSHGLDVRASLLRFTRHWAAFEIYAPAVVLRASEVLSGFRIILGNDTVYSGRAVISNLINAGETLIGEVTLDDHWSAVPSHARNGQTGLPVQFSEFLAEWQKSYKVVPEFKLVVADMRSLLADLRLWLNEIELSIRSAPAGDRIELEKQTASSLAAPALSAIDSLGDRFEEIAACLEPELRPSHIHFTRRNLHSLLLCSPFSYRTFYKPLGYAGDYEMVNMIMRQPYEGGSLFAKIVNAWFLNQLPAQAHRNRIELLKTKLAEETARVAHLKRPARIFNLGCGPASEVQAFLADNDLSDYADFTLMDFNDETVQHTRRHLQETSSRFARRAPIKLQKKSVQQLLKDATKSADGPSDGKYDFIYCAGLFDYLADRVCRQLMSVFYQWLAPGGLLLATNVDGTRPFRNKLEFILDWNLIYRNGRQLSGLKPDQAPPEICSVKSDWTSVNAFLEVRKPAHG